MGDHLFDTAWRAAALAIVTLVASSTAPLEAHAQNTSTLESEADDELRLRRWMEVRARRASEASWVPPLTIGIGSLAVGAGIAVPFLTADERVEFSWLHVVLIGVGLVDVGLGIATALAPDLARHDLEALPSGPLTQRQIGRLEAMLEADARTAERGRVTSAWLGGGAAVAGLAVLPLVAAFPPANEEDLVTAYAVAGSTALLGLTTLLTALFESPEEADWREYRQGLMPSVPQARIRPTFGGFRVEF